MARIRIDIHDEDSWEDLLDEAPRKKRRPGDKSTCTKVRSRSHAEAVARLHHLITYSQRERVPQRVYECDRCKGWHLTSQPAPGPNLDDLIDLDAHRTWVAETSEDDDPDDDPPPPAAMQQIPTPFDLVEVFVNRSTAA